MNETTAIKKLLRYVSCLPTWMNIFEKCYVYRQKLKFWQKLTALFWVLHSDNKTAKQQKEHRGLTLFTALEPGPFAVIEQTINSTLFQDILQDNVRI